MLLLNLHIGLGISLRGLFSGSTALILGFLLELRVLLVEALKLFFDLAAGCSQLLQEGVFSGAKDGLGRCLTTLGLALLNQLVDLGEHFIESLTVLADGFATLLGRGRLLTRSLELMLLLVFIDLLDVTVDNLLGVLLDSLDLLVDGSVGLFLRRTPLLKILELVADIIVFLVIFIILALLLF